MLLSGHKMAMSLMHHSGITSNKCEER